jgi:WD40 repeat protein/predicted Ser/Thr protein kinase
MSIRNLAGQRFGQYELRELLGVGGMGAVYRGYQSALQRAVAIKVISPELITQPDYIERFYREARIAAALEHAHIVPVYDYGVQGDISYVVMRLLTGGTLTDRLAQQSETGQSLPSLGEVAAMLRQLASALDYAHSQGVIHRDIKPSNVMFDNRGDAYLVDFGIAKLLAATRAITTSGVVMGTPLFMPPEQWRAEEVTPASDQYALGVMTYILVTGRVPFEADTPHGLMYKHLTEQPTPPQVYQSDVPEAVTQVLDRALAKKGEARFPSVTAYAQAFERAIQGSRGDETNFFTAPVRHTKPAPVGQTAVSGALPAYRSVLRRPVVWAFGLVGALVGIIAILALVLGGNGGKDGQSPSGDLVGTAAAQTMVAMGMTGTPTETPPQATQTLPDSALSSQIAGAKNATAATPTVAVLPETQVWLDVSATARGWTATYTPPPTETANYTATYALQLAVVGQTLTADAWTDTPSPTGTFTPTPSDTPTATSTPSDTPTATLTPTATATRTPIPTATSTPTPVPPPLISASNASQLGEENWGSVFGSTNDLAWLPDGKTLVVASSFDIALYDIDHLDEPSRRLDDDRAFFIDTIAVSPDGSTIAFSSSGDDFKLGLWNFRTGNLRALKGHTGSVRCVAFSPDGTLLASGSDDKTLRLWDVATGEQVFSSIDHNATVKAVAFSPDGSRLASGGEDGKVRIWDVQTRQVLFTLEIGSYSTDVIVFSPDGTLLAVGGNYDNEVHLWDPRTGQAVAELYGHEQGIDSLAFNPDGSLLASGSSDWTIRLWSVPTYETVAVLQRHTDQVKAVAFSPDGTRLASASMDAMRLWSVPVVGAVTQTSAGTVPTQSASAVVSLSPTPAPLPVGAVSITAANAAQLQQTAALSVFGSPTMLILLPDCRTLIVSSAFNVLRYDLGSLENEPVELVKESADSLALSPDGRILATGGSVFNNLIRLWDLAAGSVELRTLRGHTSGVNGLAFSPDGTLLASGSGDKTLRLWDVTTGQELFFSVEHHASVKAVAFSPDGTLLASGGEDGKLRIWDVASRQVLYALDSGTYSVDSVVFSPDGSLLATAGAYDNRIRLWNPRTGEAVAVLYGHEDQNGVNGGVYQLAFSPDGKLLASGGGDGTVRLWDADRASPSFGQQLAVLQGHSDWVDSVAFSPNGAFLVSASDRDGTVRLWSIGEISF